MPPQLQRYFANGTPDTTLGTNGVLVKQGRQFFTMNNDRLYTIGGGHEVGDYVEVFVDA